MDTKDLSQSIVNNLEQAYAGHSIKEIIIAERDARLYAISHNLPRPQASMDWRLDTSFDDWPMLAITRQLTYRLLSDAEALVEFDALLMPDATVPR